MLTHELGKPLKYTLQILFFSVWKPQIEKLLLQLTLVEF